MIDAKSEALTKALEDLLLEKRVVGKKERKLVLSLNSALRKIGYEVVPIHSSEVARRGRPPGRPRKRRGPGRPPKVRT